MAEDEMRLKARLARLERKAGGNGCPGCRHRFERIIVAHEHELPDGTIVRDDVPEPCALCGRLPEQVIWDTAHVKVMSLDLNQ
jgi:hypothetical protein